MRRFNALCRSRRRGTTLVEMAVVLPVFFLFIFALVEFGHAYMVDSMLNAATKRAARMGVADGVSTSQVEQKVRDILAPSMRIDNIVVQVRDASVFDTPGMNPSSVQYGSLSPIDLSTAAARQLFIVRAEVRYEDVALIPPFWIRNATLSAQSVMRHE